MCQPKPGPRCSSHARTSLDAARARLKAAEEARDSFTVARAAAETDFSARAHIQEHASKANREHTDAQVAYHAALREYETTPKGMESLEEAIARLDGEGDTRAADQARLRLDEARATRARQVADLDASRRYEERLANLTPAEADVLADADAHTETLHAAFVHADNAHSTARATEVEAQHEMLAYLNDEQAGIRNLRVALDEAKTARDAAVAEAKRLYMQAGVSERFAGFYAADMAETASRVGRGRPDRHAPDEGPQRALSVKVKASGPDREKTLAAKAAAETDEAFQAANARVAQAVEHVAAIKATNAATRTENQPRHARHQELKTAAMHARYAAEDAKESWEKAKASTDDLRARIGSGLGLAETQTVDTRHVGDRAVRNPDGTTNVYVYKPASDGFSYGRYVPAVGITEVHGMSAANAFVLENGEKAWSHERYYRSHRGAQTNTGGVQTVILTAPHEGATPLRAEGIANAGFYTFIDSTD